MIDENAALRAAITQALVQLEVIETLAPGLSAIVILRAALATPEGP